MQLFRPIFLVAGNTITGILRGVVLNVLLVLAALSVLASMTSGAFNDAQIKNMLIDSGLAVITVLGAIITILTGFTMLPTEIEQHTLYPILSKPVRRWQFVLGKYLGAAGINAVTVGLLSILFFIAFAIKSPDHRFDPRLLAAIGMIYAMLLVLSALIIFFSTFMSWIGTMISTMVIWFIGNYSQFLHDMAGKEPGFSNIVLKFVQFLIPNFQAMDLRYDIVQLEVINFTARRLLEPLGVAAIFIVVSLVGAIIIFNYREL